MIKVEPEHAREGLKHFMENNWSATHAYTYVKLNPNQDSKKVDARCKIFIQKKMPEQVRDLMTFTLIPIKNIHLYAESAEPKPSGNLNYLYLFLLVGGLTLLIACINFINLSTASSMTRAKEIGIRKALGASVSQILQLISKDFIKLIGSAMILAALMTWYLLKDWLANFAYGIDFPWWKNPKDLNTNNHR